VRTSRRTLGRGATDRPLPAESRRKVRIRLARRERTRITAALRKGRRVRVTLKLRATDTAGNTRPVVRRVSLHR
jgi:hypothetical protein